MGWGSLSLRKMALQQSISTMEMRLVSISSEIQSNYTSSSYAERVLGVQESQADAALQATYSANIATLAETYGDSSDTSVLAEYSAALEQEELSLMYNQMINESLFSAKEEAMQEAINDAELQLQLEQEQLETQLEAARAEYDALDEAVSQDIESGTISLV